jgi:16S rRNA (cytosine967-C5)-methyltransferase
LFTGAGHAPAPVAAGEEAAPGGIAPAWLEALLSQSGVADEDAAALLGRAPLDVRINSLRPGVPLPEGGEPTQAPLALRFAPGSQIEQSDAFRAGAIEVQDTGSQLACMALAAAPGETVIDLCAGAGGKTLALAAAMDNRGRILACDTDRGRLARLGPRAERAGAAIIETMLLDPGREAAALAALAGIACPLWPVAGAPARYRGRAGAFRRPARVRHLFAARCGRPRSGCRVSGPPSGLACGHPHASRRKRAGAGAAADAGA